MRRAFFATALFLVGAAAAWSQAHPNEARGFSPSNSQTFGLDTVNLFNGNLTLALPLGESYPVSERLSYRLSLVYNSQLWERKLVGQSQGPDLVQELPEQTTNAGLGWMVSLGRFNPPVYTCDAEDLCVPAVYVYMSPDGARHTFFDTLHDDPRELHTGVKYTRDGSYLRALDLPGGSHEVHFPDGTVHVFGPGGYPTEMRDAFRNKVQISYLDAAGSAIQDADAAVHWVISDGFRTQRVHFRTSGTPAYQPKLVDRVEVSSFASGTATYVFHYNIDPGFSGALALSRCHNTDPETNGIPVALLAQVTLPDATSYAMGYYAVDGSQSTIPYTVCRAGDLAALNLPTSGRIEWQYQSYVFSAASSSREYRQFAPGISVRTERPSSGAPAQWTFTQSFDDRSSPEGRLTVADPLGSRWVHYFSMCPKNCAQTDWALDYGLPFTHLTSDSGGHYLSLQVMASGSSEVDRSLYANYEHDPNLPLTLDKVQLNTQLNQRLSAARTVFDLDGGRYLQTASGLFDNLGHYRQVEIVDTFADPAHAAATDRIEWIGWNLSGVPLGGGPPSADLGLPTPSKESAWVLNTYTYTQQKGGGSSALRRFDFDRATGFLRGERRIATEATCAANDVVVTYTAIPEGEIPVCASQAPQSFGPLPGSTAIETWWGGDTKNVPADCGWPTPTPQVQPAYTFAHAYSCGVRSVTTVAVTTPTTSTLKLLDLTIDPATGLTAYSRDAAGRETSFDYDQLGRLKQSTPAGDGTTTTTRSGAGPTITTDVDWAGSKLAHAEQRLDGFGRAVSEVVWLPRDGAQVNSRPSTVTSQYNGLGWKTFVSEPSSGLGTTYKDYDPYGRPGRIDLADGSSTILGYKGARVVTRTQHVWTGQAPEASVTSREEYDALGRLRVATDPRWQLWNSPSPPHYRLGLRTRYTYDVADRLTVVQQDSGTTNILQERVFKYDGRGFLTSERHPEYGHLDEQGKKQNDRISYRYDARGNVTQASTPTGTIFYSYDEAGRLLAVSTPQGVLKKYTYGTSGSETGKVTRAVAYNYRYTNSCTPYGVQQDFLHWGTGRVRTIDTYLCEGCQPDPAHPGIQRAHWTQSYEYDGAGKVTDIGYPACVGSCPACLPGGSCTDPSRSSTFDLDFGRPESVSFQGPPFASVSYNDNGTVKKVGHADSVDFTQSPDVAGMPRPAWLQATYLGVPVWAQETYLYDSSGNIRQITQRIPGSELVKKFAYDENSRIHSATMPTAGAKPYQEYAYDAFGNLIVMYNGTSPTDMQFVDYTASLASNRLRDAACPKPGGGTLPGYDDSGNLKCFQGLVSDWDGLSQLRSANVGGETWVHNYDVAGERVWSWREGTPSSPRVDRYALRGLDGKVLTSYTKTTPSGGTATLSWEDYLYREGQLLGSALSSGKQWHFDLDHLGSIRLETSRNPDGSLTAIYHDFWPYGEEATPPAGNGAERMKFTGHERDLGPLTTAGDNASTQDDLDYMHARYYKPLWGRFVSVDPVAGRVRDLQSWNRYSYVKGNPPRLVDPNGRAPEEAAGLSGELSFIRANLGETAVNDRLSREASAGGLGAGGVLALGGTGGLVMAAERVAIRLMVMQAGRVGSGIAGAEALRRAAADGGATVRLVTNLTQAPAEGRALSASAGAAGEALANAARSGDGVRTFVANIPQALTSELQAQGLLQVRQTIQNGVAGVEYRFLPGAAQYITKFFSEVTKAVAK